MLLCGPLRVFCGSFVVLCGPLRYLVIPSADAFAILKGFVRRLQAFCYILYLLDKFWQHQLYDTI